MNTIMIIYVLKEILIIVKNIHLKINALNVKKIIC